jgi:hypothetical protein
MNEIILKELLSLIDQYCSWAVIEEMTENQKAIRNDIWMHHFSGHRILTVKFRFGEQVIHNADSPILREWNLAKALTIMETIDANFKKRINTHCCTPQDADHWLQIAVFGTVVFK